MILAFMNIKVERMMTEVEKEKGKKLPCPIFKKKNWFKFLAPCRMNDWTPVVYQSIKNRKESKMPMMQRN